MQNVRILRSRRKTLSIEVHPDGSVVVRAPLRASQARIDAVLKERQAWIKSKQTLVTQRAAETPNHHFAPAESFPYLGIWVPLEHVSQARPALDLQQQTFRLAQSALPMAREVFTKWYMQEARRVFAERMAFWQAKTGLRPLSISLSSARTRWGSCSSQGRINLTWRLIMAPMDVIDYVIVHELAHLKVKNHSAIFWMEVEKHFPSFKTQRDWLKTNGLRLDL